MRRQAAVASKSSRVSVTFQTGLERPDNGAFRCVQRFEVTAGGDEESRHAEIVQHIAHSNRSSPLQGSSSHRNGLHNLNT